MEGIYQPLIKDIHRLVKEQVDSGRIKRMEEHHAKGKEIKVKSPISEDHECSS